MVAQGIRCEGVLEYGGPAVRCANIVGNRSHRTNLQEVEHAGDVEFGVEFQRLGETANLGGTDGDRRV